MSKCWQWSCEQWVERPMFQLGLLVCIGGVILIGLFSIWRFSAQLAKEADSTVGRDVSYAVDRVVRRICAGRIRAAFLELGSLWDATAPLRRATRVIRLAGVAISGVVALGSTCANPAIAEFAIRLGGCLLDGGPPDPLVSHFGLLQTLISERTISVGLAIHG